MVKIWNSKKLGLSLIFFSVLSVVLCLFYDPSTSLSSNPTLASAPVRSIWTIFWGIVALLSMPLGLLFVDN